MNALRRIILFFVALSGIVSAQDDAKLPNVVLIFADDLGYGDLGCYGATHVQTPQIDSLARDGRRFTDAHSASAVCTPSRYALLTGEYPLRANGGQGVWGPLSPQSGLIIPTDTLTIGKAFQKKGYATSAFGKWHLGFSEGKNDWSVPLRPGPQEVGFDYYWGLPLVNSGSPYVYVENDTIVGYDPADPLVFGKKPPSPTPTFPPEASRKGPNRFGGALEAHKIYHDEKTGTLMTEKAVNWITENKAKPFFLYFSTPNIHHPFTPDPRFKGTSQCGLYGDYIHELDWMVGELLTCLEDHGLSEDTLVIFTSDNGGMLNLAGRNAMKAGHRISGDLLGFKFGAWEGGHRVPFIARWPGHIEAGTESDQLICNVDMLATFMALTGQDPASLEKKDSVNVLPAFVDDPEENIREELVLAPFKRQNLSIRRGKWMFIGARGSGGFSGSRPSDHAWGGPAAAEFAGSENSDIENGKLKADAPPAQLYDLENDPRQTKNLYRENPEVVEELSARLKSFAPARGIPDKTAAPTKYDEFKPLGDLRFTFESGKLDDWSVVEGEAGRPVSDDPSLPRQKNRPFHQEGKFHLSTIATADGVDDKQQVVFQSPRFVINGEQASFLVSGGYDAESLYVGLVDAETNEILMKAGGPRGPQMVRRTWDLTKLKGKTVYLQVVDRNSDGWGHLTFDDFSVDGTLQPKTAALEPKTSGGPNVIFMLTDDLGYSDIGCYGAQKVKTPHIDRLAAEGIQFTDFHSAASICSPSRAAFLTGAYPQRAGLYMGINPNRKAHWFLGLHPDEITLAEQFQTRGYATHMVGKWHLGTEPEFLPRKQGFETYYGMPCNFSHDSRFFDGDEVVFEKTPLDRLTELYTKRVVRMIQECAEREEPFFLYYSHNYPHTPYQASEPFKGSSKGGVRGDMMQELDWGVGEMMKALEESGIAENTLVIFTSDNGPTTNEFAKPYRGTKYVTFEGGHRVPFILHWPAKITEGSVSDVNIHAMDLFPTLSEIIGAPLPEDRIYDGVSLLPLVENKKLTRDSATPFYYYNCENLQAVRMGDWKLHLPRKAEQLPFWDKNKVFVGAEHPVLYNLKSDQAESTDVAAEHPGVVQQLLGLAEATRGELGEFMQRGKAQRPTGSLFPDVPVISHEKDWETIDSAAAEAIAKERMKRYPKRKKQKSGE